METLEGLVKRNGPLLGKGDGIEGLPFAWEHAAVRLQQEAGRHWRRKWRRCLMILPIITMILTTVSAPD